MKLPTSSVGILSLLLTAGAVGCAAPSVEEDGTAGTQAATSVEQAFVAGDYALANESVRGMLRIESASPFVFNLTVVRRAEAGGSGDLSSVTARVVDGVATLTQGEDCTLELTPAGTSVKVAQRGSCQDLGFGAFVDASGSYELGTSEAAGPTKGKYQLDTGGLGATLEIVKASPFTFNLSAVMKPSTSVGNIASGVARVEGSVATFAPDPDCKLTVEPRWGTIVVVQNGSCARQGFGASVDVSGIYRR